MGWRECPWALHPQPAHLGVGLGEQLDDAGMWHGHHTLPVNLDDAVPHADAPTLGNAAPEETADLEGTRAVLLKGPRSGLAAPRLGPGWGPHNSILHAEAQLLSGVWPVDDGCGDRRAVDNAEGHRRLRLHLLCRMGAVGLAGPPGGYWDSW